jgi:hypothetical protein
MAVTRAGWVRAKAGCANGALRTDRVEDRGDVSWSRVHAIATPAPAATAPSTAVRTNRRVIEITWLERL